MIAKNLEMETVSDFQVTTSDAGGRSQVQAKRKADSVILASSTKESNQSLSSSKRIRRSPRFTEGEANIGKSKEPEKPVASRNPSKRSPKLSGVVENGKGETFNTSSVEITGNGMRNGLTITTAIVEQNSEYLYTKSSNGAILIEDVSECDGRLAPLDLNSPTRSTKGKGARVTRTAAVREKHEPCNFFFIGEPIPCEEAQERWRWRYDLKVRSLVNCFPLDHFSFHCVCKLQSLFEQ